MDEYPRFDLTGQVALVTGAARGIGNSIALALAHAGADVALGLRDAATAGSLPDEIEAMGRKALPVQMDVTDLGQFALRYGLFKILKDLTNKDRGPQLRERGKASLRTEYSESTLWVLEDNPRAREFYERAGWAVDGARKAEARWGVRAPEVRYRKRFPSRMEAIRTLLRSAIDRELKKPKAAGKETSALP